jgi:predicted RNA-binding Zn-ribbon protein involved in translation (DUF1610 family)
MSDRPAYSQCAGKEPFSSPQVAAKVIARWTRSKRKQGKKLDRIVQSYRCPHCGFFHIGGFTKP